MPYGSSVYGTGVYERPTYNQAVDALPAPRYHWKLGESFGTAYVSQVIVDRKGNYPRNLSTFGVTSGAASLVGDSDSAATFPAGASANVFDEVAGFARPDAQWTWVVWFKPASVGSTMRLVSWIVPGGSGPEVSGLTFDSTGHFAAFMLGSNGTTYTATDPTVRTAGLSYRVTGRFDGTNLTIRVNAGTVTTTTPPVGMDVSRSPTAQIGVDSSSTFWALGTVDEVVYYNTAIPDAKDAAGYQAGRPPVTVVVPPAIATASAPAGGGYGGGTYGAAGATYGSSAGAFSAVGSTVPPAVANASAPPPTVANPPAALSGSTVGAGTTTAALTASSRITGTSTGAGTTTGALTARALITGSTTGAGTTTAALTAPLLLSGTSTGAGTTTGALTASSRLTGSSTGAGTTTGNLQATGFLSGSSTGAGTASGQLTASVRLTGTSTGAGTTAGALTAPALLTGISTGAGTTSGTLTALSAFDTAVDTTVAPLYHWKLGESSSATRVVDRKGNYPTNLLKNGVTLGVTGLVANNGGDTAASFTPTANFYDDALTPPTRPETAWTWVAYITPQTTGAAQEVVLWDLGWPHQFCGIEIDSALKPMVWRHAAGDTYPTAASTTALTAGQTYRLTARWDGSTLDLRVNASTVASLPGDTAAMYTSGITPAAVIGSAAGGIKPYSGVIDEVMWFASAISDAKDLADYVAGGGSVAASLSGTSLGAGMTSGVLTAVSQLSGSALGAGTTTATLITTPALAGAAVGVGTTSGTLAASTRLTGTATGAGTTTGALTARVFITGSVVGAGTTSGTLSIKPSVQLLQPSSDSVVGSWTTAIGATTLLAQAIDETIPDDADYIRSEASPVLSSVRFKLAAGGDPLTSSGHVIRWRVGKDHSGEPQVDVRVQLRQGGGNAVGGGSLIAEFTRSDVDALATYAETLSGTQADAITNYADLWLEFQANQQTNVLWGGWIRDMADGAEAPFEPTVIDRFARQSGDHYPSIIHWSSDWTDGAGHAYNWVNADADLCTTYGAIPLRSWAPGSGARTDGITPATIIAGSQDSYITSFATAMKNWGGRVILRFAWEMNGNWMPWGVAYPGSTTTAANYVSMWRHVHDIFTTVGATNVEWFWCPNADFVGASATLSSVYPGDAYVDWVGCDGYNADDGHWDSFHDVHKPTYDAITALAPSKPYMIGEFSSTENGGSKGQWFTDMWADLPNSFPKLRGLVIFSHDAFTGFDYPITSSTSSQSGWAAGLSNPRYKSAATRPTPHPSGWTYNSATDVSTIDLYPLGCVTGDLLVANLVSYNNRTFTSPDWTAIGTLQTGPNSGRTSRIFTRVYDGSTFYTFTAAGAGAGDYHEGIIAGVYSAASSSPIDAIAAAQTTSATPSAPSLTATTQDMLLTFLARVDYGPDGGTWSGQPAPSGTIVIGRQNGLSVSYANVNAGATGARTATINSTDWIAHSVLVKAA